MKKIIILSLFAAIFAGSYAQEQEIDYRRSSIYSIMINHTEQQFASEIKQAFILFRTNFYFRLCPREWLILAEIFFSDLTRKIQERQVFCEGAYPQRSVTEQTHTVFHSIFPSKINQVM